MRVGPTWSSKVIVIELKKGDSIDKLWENKELCKLLTESNNLLKKKVVFEIYHSFKLNKGEG